MECTTFGSHIQDIMSRGFNHLLEAELLAPIGAAHHERPTRP